MNIKRSNLFHTVALRSFPLISLAIALAWFAPLPTAEARGGLRPPPDGDYRNETTAEGKDALFSLTTAADNRAMGFGALYSNPTGSDNALASWTWRAAGRLNTARYYHKATLLQNSMVLVAGGYDSNFNISASAELYDPASRTWTVTGSLNTARYLHTPTLLQNGMVLVAGGQDRNFDDSASAELYDPASGTWTATGSLNTARAVHTATLVQNRKVLVAGGYGNFALARAELGRRHP